MIRRWFMWAFGPRGEGLALLLSIAAALAFLYIVGVAIIVTTADLLWVFG